MPVLEGGGTAVFVDWRGFPAGQTVIGQMVTWPHQAGRHVLMLSA